MKNQLRALRNAVLAIHPEIVEGIFTRFSNDPDVPPTQVIRQEDVVAWIDEEISALADPRDPAPPTPESVAAAQAAALEERRTSGLVVDMSGRILRPARSAR